MISGDYTFISQLVNNSSAVRDQLAQTQEQVASGRVSDTYAGLGNQAYASLNLGPEIKHQAAWGANIDAAQGRLDVTQSALTAISSVASKFYAEIDTFNASDPTSAQTLSSDAKNAIQQIGDLLNSKSGDVYVFAGQDTSNPPVPNTDPTVVSAALLGGGGGSAPFSSTLGTAVPKVEVGDGQYVQVGLLANANTLATSPPPTTGSYIRDTLTALANLAGLTSGSSTATATIATARGYLSSAISALSSEAGSLGNVQSGLTQRQTNLTSISTALTTQLSSVQDVDLAAAITKTSTLQVQLQASYQIIAQSRSLSLANYL